MSQEGLSDFVNAAEHSSSLRRKIRHCKSNKSLIEIALKHGFPVKVTDLEEVKTSEKIASWFRSNEIEPIRRIIPPRD